MRSLLLTMCVALGMSATAQVDADAMKVMKGAWMERQPMNSGLPHYSVAHIITDTEVITYVFGVEDSREKITEAMIVYGITSVYTENKIYAWASEGSPLQYTFFTESRDGTFSRRSRGFTKWNTKKALRTLKKFNK